MSSRLPPHPRRRASCQTPGSCGSRPQNERSHRFGEAFVLVAVGHRTPPPPLRRCGRSSKNVEPAVAPHSAACPPGDEDVGRPCQANFLPSAGTVWGPSDLKSQSVRRLPIRMFFGMIASSPTQDVTACETERTPPRACRRNAGAAPATARGLRLRRDPSSPRCGTRYPTNIYLQAPSDRCARSPCGRGGRR